MSDRVQLVMATIEEADRCANYGADASDGGEPCDGLDGCQDCLELAARATLSALESAS